MVGGAVLLPDGGHVTGDGVVHPAIDVMAIRHPSRWPLIARPAVELGGVDEGDAQLERSLDGPDALVLVRGAVERGHPHAAEPDR
jgi:hypothetical protein